MSVGAHACRSSIFLFVSVYWLFLVKLPWTFPLTQTVYCWRCWPVWPAWTISGTAGSEMRDQDLWHDYFDEAWAKILIRGQRSRGDSWGIGMAWIRVRVQTLDRLQSKEDHPPRGTLDSKRVFLHHTTRCHGLHLDEFCSVCRKTDCKCSSSSLQTHSSTSWPLAETHGHMDMCVYMLG